MVFKRPRTLVSRREKPASFLQVNANNNPLQPVTLGEEEIQLHNVDGASTAPVNRMTDSSSSIEM